MMAYHLLNAALHRKYLGNLDAHKKCALRMTRYPLKAVIVP